jgi:chromosome segregation ATPase
MHETFRARIGTVLLASCLCVMSSSSHPQSAGSGASTSPRVPTQPALSAAQTGRGSEDALLRELRLIREILQRAQGNAQREQMLIERIRTHDQRVERLDHQRTALQDEIAGLEVHVRQIEQRERSLDLQLQKPAEAAQRQPIESELKELRFTQESQRQRLDRLRQREAELAAVLLREERTLRALESRLEALDREIEAEARRNPAASAVTGR